jgi:hypothetical protein
MLGHHRLGLQRVGRASRFDEERPLRRSVVVTGDAYCIHAGADLGIVISDPDRAHPGQGSNRPDRQAAGRIVRRVVSADTVPRSFR